MITFRRPLLAVMLALVVPFAFATPKPEGRQPEPTDHLVEVKHKFFDSVKIDTTRDIRDLKKVYIEEASAEFSRYWERDHRMDVSKNYKKKTLARYARILNEELLAAVEKEGRFEVVGTRAEADLVFVPTLQRLNIYGPDDTINTKSLVFVAGNARYDLQVIDAKNGKVVVHLEDSRETADRGFSRPLRATRASNTRDFKMLMRKWSKRSLEYLNSVSVDKTA